MPASEAPAGTHVVTAARAEPRWYRRHAVFLLVLLGGAALRVLTQLSFTPAMVVQESGFLLTFLTGGAPGATYPVGYGLLALTPVSWFSDTLAPVVAVQHLLGLATGVVVYVLLLRWGVARWLAAFATMPVLWDAYQLASEHLVLPDTLFVLVVAVALLVLCWRARFDPVTALVGGALLGVATTVRLAGAPLVLATVVVVLLSAATWRGRLVGALLVTAGFGLVVVPYVAWHHQVHGQYLLAQEQVGVDRPGVTSPGTSAADDGPNALARYAQWSRDDQDGGDDVGLWRFSSYVPSEDPAADDVRPADGEAAQPRARQPGADALVAYQNFAYAPAPLMLGGLVLGLLAAAGAGRSRRSGLRAACLLSAALPAVMLLGAVSAGEDSWRHQLPGLVLLPAAGALGLTALLRGGRGPAAGRPQVDDVDRAAMAEFRERYGDPAFGPVVVVIAAYDEAVGLPQVLSTMPSTVCGLATDVVVVDDGSTDGTPDAVRGHGAAYAVTSPVNRGQGAALRLGYRVARTHGARYVITTDADGQYDTGDFPAVLSPVLDGSADFVTGSRRLGRQHTEDQFRRTGVYVFAWVISTLTGQRLTDTSFGLRAMRAEVTAAVTLNQPQYQSAELLIGARSHGYRIAEVPGTMHRRAAGSTKKGGNLIYGTRYARVVLGTWWREGCPAPATGRALAQRADPHSAPTPDPHPVRAAHSPGP